MGYIGWMVVAGTVVVIGEWDKNGHITGTPVIASFMVAIFLSLIANASEKLADEIAIMVVLLALFNYVPYFVNKKQGTLLTPAPASLLNPSTGKKQIVA